MNRIKPNEIRQAQRAQRDRATVGLPADGSDPTTGYTEAEQRRRRREAWAKARAEADAETAAEHRQDDRRDAEQEHAEHQERYGHR